MIRALCNCLRVHIYSVLDFGSGFQCAEWYSVAMLGHRRVNKGKQIVAVLPRGRLLSSESICRCPCFSRACLPPHPSNPLGAELCVVPP